MRFTLFLGLMAALVVAPFAPSLAQDKKKPDPAFDKIKDDPALPRVLIIGDSISIGYTAPTRKLLAGKANLHRIAENGGPTINGLKTINNWLGDAKWDVIHFNWGLHDIKIDKDGKYQVPLDEYEKNLRELVKRMKETKAKLIWASTTPVPEGKVSPARKNSDVIAFNAVAKKIMEENGVAIDDLYEFALPRLDKIQLPANVHFKPEGSEALAEKVAAAIQAALPKAADKDKVKVGSFQADPKVWKLDGADLLAAGGKHWSYALLDQDVAEDSALQAEIVVSKPCPRQGPGQADWFRYTIQRDDPGYDACLILRSFGSSLTENWWYRIQLSIAYQEIALHKGNGGYVKVVPAALAVDKPIHLKAEARGNRVRVWLEDKLIMDYEDRIAPIVGKGGQWGVGAFESATRFRAVKIASAAQDQLLVLPERKHRMSFRKWHGNSWFFSDDEPIARFAEGQLAEMKLLPGYQGQIHAVLNWLAVDQVPKNPDEVKVLGQAENADEVAVQLRGKTNFPAADCQNTIRVGFDKDKGTYYYDFDGAAQLNDKDPKFSQITGMQYNWLMPYSSSPNAWHGWVYPAERHLALPGPKLPASIVRGDDATYYHWEFFHGKEGLLYRVPIRGDYDSQPQSHRTRMYTSGMSLKPDVGAGRIWVRGVHPVCNPAVTFLHEAKHEPSCAVCAFSHETHFAWSFYANQLKDREVKAHYRFHGVLPSAMAKLLLTSRLPSLPEFQRTKILHKPGVNRFGPDQQNSVADPLVSVSWLGAYDVDKTLGFDDTHSLLLESNGWAEFKPLPSTLSESGSGFGYKPAPRHALSFMLRTMGIGGRGLVIEVTRDKDTERHHLGPIAASRWQPAGIVTRLLDRPGNAKVRLVLDGTGKAWIDNLELRPLGDDDKLPAGVLEKTIPVDPPAWVKALPKDAVAAWGLDEALGDLAYDWVGGHHMHLKNGTWTEIDGRRCLKLAADFDEAFGQANGDFNFPDMTIAMWIRPEAAFGRPAYWGTTLCSLSRRVNLLLSGPTPTLLLNFTSPPERRVATVKVGKGEGGYLRGERKVEANKWQHLAATFQTMPEKKVIERIFLDGELIAEGTYDGVIDRGGNALTLGCDPYQRGDSRSYGLFRSMQVFSRALSPEEVARLAK